MFFNYQHLIVLTFVRSRRFKVSHLEQYARSVAADPIYDMDSRGK